MVTVPGTAVQTRFVAGVPHASLHAYVDRYFGYVEHADGVLVRREMPGGRVVFIVGWGDPITVAGPRGPGSSPFASFTGGLSDTYAVTRLRGTGEGVELMLSPLGARRILGLPLGELTNLVVGLDDLPGRWAGRLTDRLSVATDWAERFDVLDATLSARLAETDPPDARLSLAWQRLEASAGIVEIGALAREVGWSRRHLAAQFRREIGLGPKLAARVLRFERASRHLGRIGEGGWAEVAAACGYFDQAHLIRDFREFAGATPGELSALRLEPAGFAHA